MNAHTSIPIDKVMRSQTAAGQLLQRPELGSVGELSQGRARHQVERDRTRRVHRGGRPVAADQAGARAFIAAAGRGAGKDSIISLDATHAAISFDPRGKVRPGEYVLRHVHRCATATRQASSSTSSGDTLSEVPALKKMVRDVSADSITLTNRVIIEVTTNSYRGVRGRSILRAVLDEVAHFRSENSANPDIELYGALTPGPGPRHRAACMVLISSTHKRSGLLYERYKSYYGKDDDDMLVVKGGTTPVQSNV